MKPKLSVLLPAIRPNRWDTVYRSIVAGLRSEDFELILVTPYNLPSPLEKYKNIKLVIDYGSPVRCFNIALELAEGKYCTWGADDGTWLPGSLDDCIKQLDRNSDIKTIMALPQMESQRYYAPDSCKINNIPEISSPLIPDSFVFLPTAIFHTKYLAELGGLDCSYNGHAMAHIDVSIRAQHDGAKVSWYRNVGIHLTHMPGTSGDHAPMHFSQINEDEPLYRSRYKNPEYKIVTKLPLNNWKQSPNIWHHRFLENNNRIVTKQHESA